MVRQAGLGQAGAPDGDGEQDHADGDEAVDDLNRAGRAAQGLGRRRAEEDRAADQGAEEDAQGIERLGQVQPLRGLGRIAQDVDVGVGAGLQDAQAGGENEHRADEGQEGARARRRDEQQGADGGDRQTRHDAELVAARVQQHARRDRQQQIGPEIGDLQPGAVGLADAQRLLEMLVQHVQQTIGQTPDQEAGDGEGQRALQRTGGLGQPSGGVGRIGLDDHE